MTNVSRRSSNSLIASDGVGVRPAGHGQQLHPFQVVLHALNDRRHLGRRNSPDFRRACRLPAEHRPSAVEAELQGGHAWPGGAVAWWNRLLRPRRCRPCRRGGALPGGRCVAPPGRPPTTPSNAARTAMPRASITQAYGSRRYPHAPIRPSRRATSFSRCLAVDRRAGCSREDVDERHTRRGSGLAECVRRQRSDRQSSWPSIAHADSEVRANSRHRGRPPGARVSRTSRRGTGRLRLDCACLGADAGMHWVTEDHEAAAMFFANQESCFRERGSGSRRPRGRGGI